MNTINVLSDEAWQQVSVPLDDGSLAVLELRYRPAVQRWFYGLAHPSLTLSGQMLAVHPNLLRPWRNLISFGLACLSADGADPVDISDFASGRIGLHVLSAAEVAQVETDVLGAAA